MNSFIELREPRVVGSLDEMVSSLWPDLVMMILCDSNYQVGKGPYQRSNLANGHKCFKCLIVVYFDQQMGALHTVHWSKSIF